MRKVDKAKDAAHRPSFAESDGVWAYHCSCGARAGKFSSQRDARVAAATHIREAK